MVINFTTHNTHCTAQELNGVPLRTMRNVRCNMANFEIIGAGQDTAHRVPKKERKMQNKYPSVLDACCGGRAMWFDRADSRALYIDRRNETVMFHASTGNLPHTIAPDQVCDFTSMPFPNDTFSLVVFDPPHVQREQPLGNITKRYGCLNGDWRGMLRDGFSECFRVLKPSGVLVFKWSSVQFALKEILELTPEKPLFGHQSGKRMNTHWVCFMKQESPVLGEEIPAQDTMEICHTAPNTRSLKNAQLALEL